MENKISINQTSVLDAYRNANTEQKEILEHLFGGEMFAPKSITDRIKTFDDCVEALGATHPFVEAYYAVDEDDTSLNAFCKLRVIVAALNEGWTPKMDGQERRWYPYFKIITPEQFRKMNPDQQCRVVGRAYYSSYAYGGLAYANADNAWSYAYGSNGSRLAFKNEELAAYAGKQFGEVWADFLLG